MQISRGYAVTYNIVAIYSIAQYFNPALIYQLS